MTNRPQGSAQDPQTTPAVYFLTLGCPKNEVDSDRMAATLVRSGFSIATGLDSADITVVNTCGFIRDAVEESIATILDLTEWRDALPGRKLVTVGCLVSRYGDELSDALTEPDALIPVAEEASITKILAGLIGESDTYVRAGGPNSMEPSVPTRTRLHSGPSSYLQVSDGCHRRCAYCTIPMIRGPYRSRALEEIVAEARLLIDNGAKEIVLIGQDISAYGRDLDGDETLPDVVAAMAGLDGLSWLRLMYVQPEGVTDHLLEVMAAHKNVCRYLDIPLQHASGQILRAMRRNGDAQAFLHLIERIRSVMPDIALRTTLIAGFPGETRTHVNETKSFLESAGFDYVGVFPYSPEEGTEAASLADLPQSRTRLRRAQALRDLSDKIGIEKAASRVGDRLEVLSEGLDEDGTPVGRWRGQAPEIDGLVLLDVSVEPGQLVEVEITDSFGYDLEGRVIR